MWWQHGEPPESQEPGEVLARKREASAARAGFVVGLIVGAVGYPIILAFLWFP